MASLARRFFETLSDAPASRIFTRRAVDWATVMPRLRVTTTTPTSLKIALRAATDSAFCERSMPYSFTCDRGAKPPRGRLRFRPCRSRNGRVRDGEGACRSAKGVALQEGEAKEPPEISFPRLGWKLSRADPGTNCLGRMTGGADKSWPRSARANSAVACDVNKSRGIVAGRTAGQAVVNPDCLVPVP